MRERTDNETLEQGFAMLGIDVRTSSEVRGLQQKDGIRAEDFVYICSGFCG